MSTNTRQALGLIESWGQLPLITAVDAALKAARVKLASFHLVGGGLSTATVCGDVGAVTAALDAAGAVFAANGAKGMTHVIARPDSAVWAMLAKDGHLVDDDPPEGSGGPPALRTKAQAPVLKAAAGVPAERAAAETPAARPKAGPLVVQAESAQNGGGKAPKAKKSAPKTGGKKPRKPKP